MIPWEELGFIVAGSFQNGVQALEHIESERPDVVITDIGMPVMDGLELIRNIKTLILLFILLFYPATTIFNMRNKR
jgi:two-component system response regulator YesN